MRVHCLEIPEQLDQIPRWLEEQLVGTDLGALAAELATVHRSQEPTTQSIDDLLGRGKDEVLTKGLSSVSPSVIQKLLTEPRLLLELQQLILTEGGGYWDQLLARSKAHDPIVAQGKMRLGSWSETKSNSPTATASVRPPRHWLSHPLAICLATAASLLVAVFLYERLEQRSVTGTPLASKWGWNKPDALPQTASAPEYLNRLADEAGEWFNKKPTAAADVARRILEFRQGCSVLMLSPHGPLAPADRQWLVERCQKWATALDQQVVDLEAGKDPAEVRTQADMTIQKLIDALRERAKTV